MMKFALGLLSLLMVYFFSTIETAATDSWEEDFRRCRVLKPFSQGSVIISAGEEMVELDVQWKDGADLNNLGVANISVQIDDVPLPHPQPLKSDTGVIYGYSLGSFNAILPALSRGKRLRISIPDKPERFVDFGISAGGKEAVAFLRKCHMYWTNFHIATNAWERGRASAKLGEYARAIEDFNQAIQKLPKDYTTKRARILFERGQAKLRKGDKTGGNADIRAATKLRRWIATMDDINP
jgi:tetratricopeptide (TPR) repeat protein